MAAEELTVRGLTGVDMTLTVAGPGTRSYAFVIDWHARLLLGLAWVLLGLLLRILIPHGPETALRSSVFLLVAVAPAVLIYLLYHPVLEVAMRGRTPGKRMAGARIVTREGATPGTGALLMRNLFRLIDSLPLFYVVGLVCCLATAQRVRIGDLAAGTVLVLDETAAAKSLSRLGALLQRSRLQPEALALVEDLLDRWAELGEERRLTLARTVLSRLDARSDPTQLAVLDETALRSRLQALLADEPG
ncbi:MAG: RDD family protein [Steroidobacteraceae bacterium]